MSEEEPVVLGPVEESTIRVVVFGGGPRPERGVQLFLTRLEAHPEIELAGAVVQSGGASFAAVVGDLWRRRRLLALPVLGAQVFQFLRRYLSDPGETRALKAGMAVLEARISRVPDIHAPAVLDRVRALRPHLGLVYGSPILRAELFGIPRWGSLGIHHGRMPEYRGKKTTFWEMAKGEDTAGVTIQRIGSGLDTGAVVAQGSVPVGGKSYGEVWAQVEDLGVALYVDAVLDTKRGRAECRPSTGEPGPLLRDPGVRDLLTFYARRLMGRR